MPRPDLAGSVAQAAEQLIGSITALVQNLHATVTSAPGGRVSAAATSKRGPGKGNPKLKAALRAYWAKMKGKARAQRVAKMLAGRGIKAQGVAEGEPKAKRAAKSNPAKTKPGGAWASMTPEQRAERVAKMQAGRSRRPDASAPKVVAVSRPTREVSLLND